jgi:hypothetical protein
VKKKKIRNFFNATAEERFIPLGENKLKCYQQKKKQPEIKIKI